MIAERPPCGPFRTPRQAPGRQQDHGSVTPTLAAASPPGCDRSARPWPGSPQRLERPAAPRGRDRHSPAVRLGVRDTGRARNAARRLGAAACRHARIGWIVVGAARQAGCGHPRACGLGRGAGRPDRHRPPRPDRLCRILRRARPGRQQGDGGGCHLSPVFDDQADRQRRGDDAGRGGACRSTTRSRGICPRSAA